MTEMLDEKDLKILEVLKDHADYSTRQIAKMTLLPVTTIHNRIQRMKRDGVIKKFTVEVDHKKVDRGMLVYILINASLPVLKQKRMTQYDLAKRIRKFDFVERVDIVGGGTDLVAMIRVKDVEEYDKVLLGKLQMIEGIDGTQSLIVIHQE